MADTTTDEKVQEPVPQSTDDTKQDTTEAEPSAANDTEEAKDETTNEKEESKDSRTENTERRREPRRADRPDAYTHRKKRGTRANYESLEESNDENAIRKQVEFYFSDSNLPTDAYLLKLTGGSENKPVPLKTIHDFKRMRHFQPFSVVRTAVKASKILDLNENDEITRKTPLDSKFTGDVASNADMMYDSSIGRSVYVKGFGKEYSTLQLDLESFFQPYGPYNSVRMRRSHDNEFKGSVFVEFANEDLAKQFLEQDPKPVWEAPKQEKKDDDGKKDGEEKKDEDAGELMIMSKLEYVQGKNEGIRNGTVRPSSPRRNRGDNYRGRGRGRGRGGRNDGNRRDDRGRRDRGDRDAAEDWRERRNRDQGREDRDNKHGKGGRHENGNNKKRAHDDTEEAGEKTEAKKQKASEE
ncbi:hypothetical protein AMS68_006768 [Peltaster fructicola]|uniref:HTH La-type RNA-binding domain-containing protein n=1 Tax=Peltaster fructicola TaxID=286661 RepID=A0A6H0Y2W3_9PEZI|nr:hypothetical protein AMS68_006768 [Peltaster fructicola]